MALVGVTDVLALEQVEQYEQKPAASSRTVDFTADLYGLAN